MIIGIGGKLSGGKTCTMVHLALKLHKENKKKIVSNIKLYGVEYTYIESEELIDFIIRNKRNEEEIKRVFYDSVLLIDEIRNLISARKSSSNLNEVITQFLMMLGKLDCFCLYTYQVLGSQVDLQMREITSYQLECFRIDEKGKNLQFEKRVLPYPVYILVAVYEYTLEKLVYLGKFILDPVNVYKFYNTREIIIVDRDKYLKR